MGADEETRQLLQDVLAPEIRSIKTRLDGVDKQMEAIDHRLEKLENKMERHHEEVMAALRQLTDYTALLQRVARLEARQEAQPPR